MKKGWKCRIQSNDQWSEGAEKVFDIILVDTLRPVVRFDFYSGTRGFIIAGKRIVGGVSSDIFIARRDSVNLNIFQHTSRNSSFAAFALPLIAVCALQKLLFGKLYQLSSLFENLSFQHAASGECVARSTFLLMTDRIDEAFRNVVECIKLCVGERFGLGDY